jgi:hypothetical protein
MALNVIYYVKIEDPLTNSKIFSVDTSQDNQLSSVFHLSVIDSIYAMHPYGTFVVYDASGKFFSNLTFAEGHKFRITLGYVDYSQGYKQTHELIGDFYWSNAEIIESEETGVVSGSVMHSFTSAFHLKDGLNLSNSYSRGRRFYGNKSISNVVKDIISSDFIKNDSLIKISRTKGIRDWYLLDKTPLNYIDDVLRKYAISPDNDSPFFTFFNLKNEFHFRSASDISQNKPISTVPRSNKTSVIIPSYVLKYNNPNSSSDVNSIMNYTFMYTGTSTIQDLISSRSYSYSQKNTKVVKLNTNLSNQIYQPRGKLPVKSPLFFNNKRENTLKEVKYTGLFSDETMFKATVYNEYINAIFPIRMTIQIYFNPEAVAGRVILLTSYDFDKALNQILSGLWVILKSEHRYERQEAFGNRMIVSVLTIGKNSFNYDDSGGFYYDSTLKNNYIT